MARSFDPDRPVRVCWSGVRNQTHVVYAASWLRTLLARTTGPITLVDMGIGGFLGKNMVTLADVHELLPHHSRLTFVASGGASALSQQDGESRYYLATGAVGIKPWLRLKSTRFWAPLTVVTTDEGIGTYGDWRTRRDAYARQGGKGPWPTVRALGVTWASSLLTDRKWRLFEKRDGTWTVNQAIADEFRRYHPDAAPDTSTAVFMSQPWVELGVLSADRYLQHLRLIAAEVESVGLRFVVRPHPAEDVTRYADWEVLGGSRPAELDPRITTAGAVLGTTSTALLNLAAIFGRRAIRIAIPELDQLTERLSPDQAGLLDTFLPEPRAIAAIGASLR